MIHKIGYSTIQSERVMRACTGVDFARLEELALILSAYYKKTHGIDYFEMIRNLNLTDEIIFSDYKDIVFFVLYCKKVGNTNDVLGVTFGTSGANVHHNVSKFTPILAAALADLGHAPLREITHSEEVAKLGEPGAKKIIDGTEFPIEKPKNKAVRDKSYSVKKKRYCIKTTIISGKNKRIDFMGKIFSGSEHDYTMLKIEFPIWRKYFAAFYILVDLGYLGFQKDYDCINVRIPIKKPKKSEKNPNPKLTADEKNYNKSLSQERIFVENAISGLKRYHIISNRLRIKKAKYRDDTLLLCASLWNYYLAA